MRQAIDGVTTMVPALLFLCAGVPLAALLDRLGFFDAVATRMARPGRPVPVAGLWILAAGTTVVLNLDTTVVLLTPLYVRLARRTGATPWRWPSSRSCSPASPRRCCPSPTSRRWSPSSASACRSATSWCTWRR